MKKHKSFLLVCFLLLSLYSCRDSYQSKIISNVNERAPEFLIDANKMMIEYEEKIIDSLLNISTIPFSKDNSGIRICLNKNNKNDSTAFPDDGDNITILYNCVIFDDVNLISNDVLVDTIRFKIGHSKQMKGLNYAIKLLKVGDKAKIIIPSYLGFGMSGYGKTVPPYSTLLLNVKLLNIKK
ncbi:MAG: hypothetical protein CMP49_06425 [Flavobacteriales bacterium]|nr:hypothetical protein [Flavobacteriales bacterium]|tara:strand:- start:38052 stop:38597 length:546 start_codon:yes stop_codon:yes gene_type:complete